MSSTNEESTDASIDEAKPMTPPVQVEVSEHPVRFFGYYHGTVELGSACLLSSLGRSFGW